MTQFDNKIARYCIGCLAVLIALLALPAQYLYNQFPRSPFQQAIQETANQMSADEIILHDNKLSYLPTYIYYPDVQQVFLADEPGSSNDTFAVASQQAMGVSPEETIESAVDGYTGVYFVVFSRTIEEYKSMHIITHPVLDWLDKHYRFVEKTSYQDLEIYHFSK